MAVTVRTNHSLQLTGVAPSGFLWPTSVDTTNRKLLDQNGDVWLCKTFSSWGMGQGLTDAEIVTAFDLLDGSGLNALTVAPCGVNIQADWTAGQYKNAAGDNYFTGAAFQSSLGPAWSTMDLIIDEAYQRGYTILWSLFISYGTSGTGPAMEAATNAQMRTFGQNVATRYLAYPNIIWHMEFDDGGAPSSTRGRRTDWFMRGITETETTPRLQMVEPLLNGTAGFDFITSQGTDPTGYQWFHISANSMYSYENNSVEQFDPVFAGEHTTYPVFDCEPPYMDSLHYEGNRPQNYRERHYAIYLRGGCGINNGFEDWMRFGFAGNYTEGLEWDEVPGTAKYNQMTYALNLVDTYCAVLDWRPSSTFVTTGVGSGDTKAAVGSSSTAALAYFPSSRTVTVDTTIISGSGNVRIRWYDPVLGTFSTVTASEAQQSGRTVSYPSNHADGQSDYVLVVDLV
jgi:hypothetical protein